MTRTPWRWSRFCGLDLAERIELAEADLIAHSSEGARRRAADTAGFVIAVARRAA